MNLDEYQWSRSLFDLGQRSLRFQNLILFFPETVETLETLFHMKACGNMGMRIYANILSHLTKTAAMIIDVKTSKNLLRRTK